jgi:hypothetical protein
MDGTLKFVNYMVGDYTFTETQYFIEFLVEILSYVKPEGLTQFDVFHTFVENSVKSEFLFS